MSTAAVPVLHVITGLGTGGAETSLLRLLQALDREEFPAEVVSLGDQGTMGSRIVATGVPVHALGLSPGRIGPRAVMALRATVRAFRPRLIQGWMYHGNLAAMLAARLSGQRLPVLWNIRHSLSDPAREKPLTRVVIATGARCSHRAAGILYNALVSATQHEAYGFDPSRRHVIHNGIDTAHFTPDRDGRARARRHLGFDAGATVIGAVGRFHPQKAHLVFLDAAEVLLRTHDHVEFLLAGPGVDPSNAVLAAAAARPGLAGRVHLVGEQRDMPAVYRALDLLGSSSVYGEGFPNVVAEAMACEVPCVVTDVGDSAHLVGDTGRVVAPGDAQGLAQGWAALLDEGAGGRAARGAAARRRIRERFSLERAVGRYADLYRNTAAAA